MQPRLLMIDTNEHGLFVPATFPLTLDTLGLNKKTTSSSKSTNDFSMRAATEPGGIRISSPASLYTRLPRYGNILKIILPESSSIHLQPIVDDVAQIVITMYFPSSIVVISGYHIIPSNLIVYSIVKTKILNCVFLCDK